MGIQTRDSAAGGEKCPDLARFRAIARIGGGGLRAVVFL